MPDQPWADPNHDVLGDLKAAVRRMREELPGGKAYNPGPPKPKHCPHCGALHTRPKPVQDRQITAGRITPDMLRQLSPTGTSISTDGGKTWTSLGNLLTGPITLIGGFTVNDNVRPR